MPNHTKLNENGPIEQRSLLYPDASVAYWDRPIRRVAQGVELAPY